MADDFTLCITADEAFPAFERLVLGAQDSVVAGFRIFDMTTRLRSDEARAIGETWFDLLAHVVARGVRLDLTVSDFDPIMATDLHETAWTTVRQGAALAELAGAGQVRVRAHLHPATAGWLPRLAFLPAVLKRRRKELDARSEAELDRAAVRLDGRPVPDLHTASHHQKIAVIDDTWLYVGGLDLDERRFDTTAHDRPSHETWSDVQAIVRGPEAVEARHHLESFTEACAGQRPPSPAPHLLRTLSAPRRVQFPFLSPRTVLNELEEAHLRAFAEARHHLHIETQFLRSRRIAEAMAEAATRVETLTCLVIMPGAPDELAHQGHDSLDMRFGISLEQEAVQIVQQAFGDRITLASPVRPVMASRPGLSTLAGSDLIHVHNKVLVKDDDLLLISSANLNGRSMRWDTETGILRRGAEALALPLARLMAHWWFDPLPDTARAPETLYPWWRQQIRRNGVSRPEARSGFLVPFDADKTRDLAQPLPGVTEEVV